MLRGSALSSSRFVARCSGHHRLALVRGAHTASQRGRLAATVTRCNRPLGPGLLAGSSNPGLTAGRRGSRALSSSAAAEPSSSRSVRVHISLGAVLLCGAAGYGGYCAYNGTLEHLLPEPHRAKEERALAALLNSNSTPPSTSPSLYAASPLPNGSSNLAPRPALVSSLVSLLSPRARRCAYVVVYGEPGSGKSQAVGEALSQAGPGVLCVTLRRGDGAEVEQSIKDMLQWEGGASHVVLQAIEQARDWLAGGHRGSASRGGSGGEGVSEVLHTLETVALKYREVTGQSPTLVIDGVERLGVRDPMAFQALMQGAREAAARGALSTVLVCGDGHVLRDMRGRECWSRSVDVVEVGDLSNKEAITYLVEQRKLKLRDARRAVGLLGGRLVELNKAADALQDGDNWEGVEREAWQSMEACYSRLLRLLHTPNTNQALKTTRANKGPALSLLCALLEEPSGVLAYDDVCRHVGGTATADALLSEGSGVLSLDASGWGVRFQSPMATHYALAVCKASGVRVRRRRGDGDRGPGLWGGVVRLVVLGGVGYWAYSGGAAGAVGGLQTLGAMSREEWVRAAQDSAEGVGRRAEQAVQQVRETVDRWMR